MCVYSFTILQKDTSLIQFSLQLPLQFNFTILIQTSFTILLQTSFTISLYKHLQFEHIQHDWIFTTWTNCTIIQTLQTFSIQNQLWYTHIHHSLVVERPWRKRKVVGSIPIDGDQLFGKGIITQYVLNSKNVQRFWVQWGNCFVKV